MPPDRKAKRRVGSIGAIIIAVLAAMNGSVARIPSSFARLKLLRLRLPSRIVSRIDVGQCKRSFRLNLQDHT